MLQSAETNERDPNRWITQSSMVYDYPEFSEMIGQELMQHYEFSSLITAEQVRLTPGDFFNYQLFGMRFVNEYAKIFCILEPGTGKTCYAIGSVERAIMIDDIVDVTLKRKRTIKHCYYVTTSDLLISEVEKQIICSCTNRRYYNDKIENSHMDTGRTKAVRKEINRFYTVVSYSNFKKNHIGDLTDDQLREKFDNSFIILDEAHTLRNNLAHAEGEENAIYFSIRNMLHIAKTHTIVATATPMLDKVGEFVPLMNYILPEDMQMPAHGNNAGETDYTDWTYDDFAPYFRGRIAYVRAQSFGLEVIESGMSLSSSVLYQGREFESQMKIVPLIMSEYQSDAYLDLRESAEYSMNNYIKAKTLSAYYNSNHQRTMGNKNYDKTYAIPTEVIDDLYKYSCKFYEIAKSCMNNPGKHFIYWSLLEGGLSILVAIMQAFDYELFTGSNKDIFRRDKRKTIKIGAVSKLASYCDTDSTGEGEIDETKFPAKPRVTLLCGDTRPRPQKTIRELYNHPLNINGDFLQVLIGSPAVKLGVNLKDVKYVHVVGPEWNRGSTFQAEHRAIRAESHIDTLQREEARIAKLIDMGSKLTPEEMKPNVTVTINRYVALPRYIELDQYNDMMREADPDWLDLDYDNPTEELSRLLLDNIIEMTRNDDFQDSRGCIDTFMYETSEKKEIAIRRVMRIMKQYAIDCSVNKIRNMQDYGAGTIDCDYDDCEYTCDVDYLNGELITEVGTYKPTYNSMYLDRIIDQLDVTLKANIGKYTTLSWEDLFEQLSSDILFDDAIVYNIGRKLASRYINNPVTINNAGLPMFIGVNASGFYLSDRKPDNDKSLIVTSDNMTLRKTNLKSYLATRIEAQQPVEQRYILTDELIDSMDSMDIIDRSRIIEYAITVPDNDFAKEIMDIYQFYIYRTPKRELRSKTFKTLEDVNVSRDEFVTLLTFPSDVGSKFTVSSSLRTPPMRGVRIYEDGEWGDLTNDKTTKENKYSMYKGVIQDRLDAIVEPFDNHSFAYYSLVDHNIRVSPPGYRGVNDKRNIARGTVCGNIIITVLVKAIADLGEDVIERILELTGLEYPTDDQMQGLPVLARLKDIDLNQFPEEWEKVLLYLLVDNFPTSSQICKKTDIEALYNSYGRFLVT